VPSGVKQALYMGRSRTNVDCSSVFLRPSTCTHNRTHKAQTH
jgi:hypothetical protein